MIISVLNPKGGSGKTTLATCLARGLQMRGDATLLVDSDPQGSARDWQAASEENPVPLIAMDRASAVKGVPSHAAGFDWTVIDGAGRLEDIMAAALRVSDLVLIPVQPSPYDIWALEDLVDLVRQRQEIAEGSPSARAVISRAIHGTRLGSEVTEALSELELAPLEARTYQRQIYARSAAEGKTPMDIEPSGQAANELRILVEEVVSLHPTSE